ncbi:hypothetical protein CsSME_00035735 [Camellia sinensis var. sinensis]
MAMVRSLYRSICFRYLCSSSAAANHHQHLPQGLYYFHLSLSSSSPLSIFSQNHPFRLPASFHNGHWKYTLF